MPGWDSSIEGYFNWHHFLDLGFSLSGALVLADYMFFLMHLTIWDYVFFVYALSLVLGACEGMKQERKEDVSKFAPKRERDQ